MDLIVKAFIYSPDSKLKNAQRILSSATSAQFFIGTTNSSSRFGRTIIPTFVALLFSHAVSTFELGRADHGNHTGRGLIRGARVAILLIHELMLIHQTGGRRWGNLWGSFWWLFIPLLDQMSSRCGCSITMGRGSRSPIVPSTPFGATTMEFSLYCDCCRGIGGHTNGSKIPMPPSNASPIILNFFWTHRGSTFGTRSNKVMRRTGTLFHD